MLRSFGDRCNGYVTHVGVIHVFAPVGFYLVQALRFVDIFFFLVGNKYSYVYGEE